MPLAPRLTVETALAAALAAERVAVFLDYDGTLVEIAARPDLARPDAELIGLLADLSRRTDYSVHVVSGRPRAELERWFGALPLGLHAEHGMYSRIDGDWVARGVVPEDLRARVKSTLEQVASCTPGSHVEVKANGTPLEVLAGDKVVEVRLRGMHKGLVVRGLLRPGDLALAVGDDRTDEDLFAALPDDAMTVKVGRGSSVARHYLPDVAAVRALLRALADRGWAAGSGRERGDDIGAGQQVLAGRRALEDAVLAAAHELGGGGLVDPVALGHDEAELEAEALVEVVAGARLEQDVEALLAVVAGDGDAVAPRLGPVTEVRRAARRADHFA